MAIKIEEHHISLSVRDLLSPAAPQQMLSSFPLPQRGMLGRQAQTRVQQQKKHSYGLFHSEYTVRREYQYQDYTFIVQGRIDGVYQLKKKVEIEEIKSVILTGAEFKNLHIEHYPEFIEQVLFYAYLLQDELQGVEVSAFLILINLVNEARRSFPIDYNRLEVEQKLLSRFSAVITNIEREKIELQRRSAELSLIDFSLPEHRPQQQTMIAAVRDCLKEGKHLLVSAPTGVGKTAAALFPAIQFAYPINKKIFFVTSKTTQQHMVEQTLLSLLEQRLDIHVIFLRAAEKMCANNIFFCHEAYCPYAKDYYERLMASNLIDELLQTSLLLPEDIYQRSTEKFLCPFEVSLDLSLHVDMIVGDYNYVFDPAVYLRRLFNKKDYSDWTLIIDEAHNLYPRGMDYLSPSIKKETLQQLIVQCQNKKDIIYNEIADALEEINRLLSNLHLEGEIYYSGQQYFQAEILLPKWDEAYQLLEAAFIKYLIFKIKRRLLIMDDPIEKLYYQIRRFVQVAQYKDRAFVPFYNAQDDGILKIQCCDPSLYLQQRMEGFHSVIAMSATLDPMPFYQDVLGFADYRTTRLQLDSPFPAENRKIIIIPDISARYKERARNYGKIAEVIEKAIQIKSGNYLVFFPSFDFVQQINLFLGKVRCEKILQKPGMNEEERDRILQEFKENETPHLLLAVMGGVFSEGVDFTGNMAIGVMVVSPGLPQISFERELLRQYYQEKNSQGFEYAYIYPGMNKVIQSVGRLIRTATDRGVVLLIDERFANENYHKLLPEFWFAGKGEIVISNDFEEILKKFWESFK